MVHCRPTIGLFVDRGWALYGLVHLLLAEVVPWNLYLNLENSGTFFSANLASMCSSQVRHSRFHARPRSRTGKDCTEGGGGGLVCRCPVWARELYRVFHGTASGSAFWTPSSATSETPLVDPEEIVGRVNVLTQDSDVGESQIGGMVSRAYGLEKPRTEARGTGAPARWRQDTWWEMRRNTRPKEFLGCPVDLGTHRYATVCHRVEERVRLSLPRLPSHANGPQR